MSTLAERFWAKVDKTGDCWLWTASKYHDGYGQFRVGDRPRRAHRVAYELVRGPIPDGLVLDHLCRVHACVNPDHLEPVTDKVNIARGRAREASLARRNAKTHCVNGHELTDQNIYIRRNGLRECRTCLNAASRRYRAAKTTDQITTGATS